jgi:hypothetical protein
MPYRKARSHQERIPWASSHPTDVKRGTFIGEMSRLATLSSLNTTYIRVLESLKLLYVKRGYPEKLVVTWLKKYSASCWDKRLSEVKQERTEVLVLKSEFNEAWNYFSAKELGNTIIGFWREWITRAKNGNFSLHFPQFSGTTGDIGSIPEELVEVIFTPEGKRKMPDVTKLGFEKRRFIVSRKRTKNLFDLTALWKKVVLTGMDEHASVPNLEPPVELDNDEDLDSDESESEARNMAQLTNMRLSLGQAWLAK